MTSPFQLVGTDVLYKISIYLYGKSKPALLKEGGDRRMSVVGLLSKKFLSLLCKGRWILRSKRRRDFYVILYTNPPVNHFVFDSPLCKCAFFSFYQIQSGTTPHPSCSATHLPLHTKGKAFLFPNFCRVDSRINRSFLYGKFSPPC